MGIPTALVSLFGGVWADRHSRKLLIIGSDLAMALVSLSLAFAMLNDVHDTWLLFLALGIRSAFAGVQCPAAIAALPQIVPADRLLRTNGIKPGAPGRAVPSHARAIPGTRRSLARISPAPVAVAGRSVQ